MRSTCWIHVPSGLPGLRPRDWNCLVIYATARSSPGVPGPRPSIESAERSLICPRIPSAVMALAAGGVERPEAASEPQALRAHGRAMAIARSLENVTGDSLSGEI